MPGGFRRTTVEISGAVNAPTAVTVNGRRSITYYVSAGGGASSVGDARNAYVVQPNGKIESSRRFLWIIPRNPRPRAGATVVVPLKAATSATSDRLASISIIVQTIASLATVVAILK